MGNAVDKHRKQLKKKELKKNKAKREEQREFSLVKKDVRGVQAEISELEKKADRTAEDNERLGRLRAELSRSVKAKEKYAEEHPEARQLLFPVGGPSSSSSTAGAQAGDDDGKGLYTKDGKLRHPERSAYYHPVFNPYGVPPPGMPYKERDPTPPLSDSEDSDDSDIPMPDGAPPPSSGHDDDDSSDDESSDDDSSLDIPLPEGPPPPKEAPPVPKSFPQPHHYDPARRTIHAPPRQAPIVYGAPPVPMYTTSAQPGALLPATIGAPPVLTQTMPKPPPVAQAPAQPTISAAPVLRDLKKEATAFVPHALKRKK